MLSKAQEKLIRSLHTKKGRVKAGLCLVEGEKVITTAGSAIDFTFSKIDTEHFDDLVTTDTPQELAAVAKIPQWTLDTIKKFRSVVILDGVQDPGNVGTILRLCLGFQAALLLIDSADVTNPKVIRSSVGAMFQVPWLVIKRNEIDNTLKEFTNYTILRLEKSAQAMTLSQSTLPSRRIIVAGAEGQGITLPVTGKSIMIEHESSLESLNVAQAVGIILYQCYKATA